MSPVFTAKTGRPYAGVAATLLMALTLGGAQAQDAPSQSWDQKEAARYQNCLADVERAPDDAYENGLAWLFESGGAPARHCVAAALIALGHLEEGAARLADAALSESLGDDGLRVELLSQAAAAWAAAERPEESHTLLSLALSFAPQNPDILVDRAIASAMMEEYVSASRDLSLALAERPRDALALRLRAEAWLALGETRQAADDVQRALRIAPDDIDTLLMRGKVRQALTAEGLPDIG